MIGQIDSFGPIVMIRFRAEYYFMTIDGVRHIIRFIELHVNVLVSVITYIFSR